MPASELGWSSPKAARMPIFQVYGTKRKANSNPPTECGMAQEYESQMMAAKRKCSWDESPMSQTTANNSESQYLNTTPPNAQHGISTEYVDWQMNQNLQSCQNLNFPQNNNNQEANNHLLHQSLASQSQEQEAQNMDTFTEELETEGACTNMDSDCAPDPSQYGTKASECCDEQNSRNCRQFCGMSQDAGVSISRVRCFCKPSWEGMMEMKPYISDIY